jgi:hypothetical protein
MNDAHYFSTLKPITALHVRKNLGEVLSETAVEQQRFVIQHAGIPMAVMLSLMDYRALLALAERGEATSAENPASPLQEGVRGESIVTSDPLREDAGE